MTRAMVAAHRGVPAGAAENTIAAFTNAIDIGAGMIEFDVRRTRDGELIAFHDAQVGGVPVASLSRDEIEAGAGVRPPLLAEVLRVCAGRIQLDVELKEDGYVADVMAVLAADFDVDQMIVTSFLPAVVAQAKDVFPEVRTGLLVGDRGPWLDPPGWLRGLYPVSLARQIRADFLAPHYRLASFGVVRRAAAAGLPCLLWTVNSPDLIRKYAADPRIAAIITDEAAQAMAIVSGDDVGWPRFGAAAAIIDLAARSAKGLASAATGASGVAGDFSEQRTSRSGEGKPPDSGAGRPVFRVRSSKSSSALPDVQPCHRPALSPSSPVTVRPMIALDLGGALEDREVVRRAYRRLGLTFVIMRLNWRRID